MDLPFERTWWIEPGMIIGGRFPGTASQAETLSMLKKLVDVGVGIFVNLQEYGNLPSGGPALADYRVVVRGLAQVRGRNVEFIRFPIPDSGIPDIRQMRRILRTLHGAVAEGKLVYVHCHGGHGRTATVAGCWMIEQGLSAEQALARIKASRANDGYLSRKNSPKTPEQTAFIRAWHEQVPIISAQATIGERYGSPRRGQGQRRVLRFARLFKAFVEPDAGGNEVKRSEWRRVTSRIRRKVPHLP